MLDFGIADTHVHLWEPQKLHYAWLKGVPKLNRPFLPADYDAACGPVHVEKIVFVQCDCQPEQYLAEVAWVTSLADRDKRIGGIVAFAPLEKGRAVRDELAELSTNKLVKGVRRLLQAEVDDEFCLRPEFLEGVATLPDFGLSFDICIKHSQLKASAEMVRRLPQVQFVLDHVGKPDIKSQRLDPWRQDIIELSKLPNVSCKISGLVTEADLEHWQPTDLHPYIDHVLDSFGRDRVMFGSDWPVVQLACEYRRWVETLVEAMEKRSSTETRRLFHDNAVAIYRL